MRIRFTKVTQTQFKKNLFSGSILSIVNAFLILLAYPYYLKFLGPDLYGLWALLAIIISLSQMGELGINDSLIKYISDCVTKKNNEKLIEYATTYLVFFFIITLLIVLLIYIFRNQILNWLNIQEGYHQLAQKLIIAICLIIILVIVNNSLRGILSGIGRIDTANYVFISFRIIQICLAIFLLYLDFGIWALYFSNLVIYFGSIITYIVKLRNYKITFFKIKDFKIQSIIKIFKLGGSILFARISQRFFIDEMIKLLISKYFGLAQLTYYEISFKSIQIIRSFFVFTFRAIIPEISIICNQLSEKLVKLVKQSIIYIIIPTIPLLVILILYIQIFFQFWLQDNYNFQISINFKILMIGYIFNILIIPMYNSFIGTGNTKMILRIAIYSVLIFIFIIVINIITQFPLGVNTLIWSYSVFILLISLLTYIYFIISLRTNYTTS